MDQALFRKLSPIDRRSFLRTGFTAAGFVLATHGSGLRTFAQTTGRKFSPVRVSRDRIIREIVGLRPFRSEGYVVEAQRVGNKLLIHNYGHGGAGITLSWGTATQAVDLLRDFPQPAPSRRTPAAAAQPGRSARFGPRLRRTRRDGGAALAGNRAELGVVSH